MYYNHERALFPENFKKNQRLRDFFQILATSRSVKGSNYIAVMEGIKYPVYGT